MEIPIGTNQSSFRKEKSLSLFFLLREMWCRGIYHKANTSHVSVIRGEYERGRKHRKCLYFLVTSSAISEFCLKYKDFLSQLN